jgi:hypothetical protein
MNASCFHCTHTRARTHDHHGSSSAPVGVEKSKREGGERGPQVRRVRPTGRVSPAGPRWCVCAARAAAAAPARAPHVLKRGCAPRARGSAAAGEMKRTRGRCAQTARASWRRRRRGAGKQIPSRPRARAVREPRDAAPGNAAVTPKTPPPPPHPSKTLFFPQRRRDTLPLLPWRAAPASARQATTFPVPPCAVTREEARAGGAWWRHGRVCAALPFRSVGGVFTKHTGKLAARGGATDPRCAACGPVASGRLL